MNKAADCEYEYDRRLTEQFIHGLDNKGLVCGTLREILALEIIDIATSE